MAITRESITVEDIQVIFWNHLRQPLGAADWSQMTFAGEEPLNDVGTWRITAPAGWQSDWLARNSITANKDVAGISVYVRGQFMFSGPVLAWTSKFSQEGQTEEILGATDNVLLADTMWTPINGRRSLTKVGSAIFIDDPHVCLREALELQWGTPAQSAGYPIKRPQSDMVNWAAFEQGTSTNLASVPLDSTGTLLSVMQTVSQFDGVTTCFRMVTKGSMLTFQSWESADHTADVNLTTGAGDLDEVEQTSSAPAATAMWVDRTTCQAEPMLISNSAWASRARVFGRGSIETAGAWLGDDINLAERAHLASGQLAETNRNITKANCRVGGNTRFMLGQAYQLGDRISITAGSSIHITGQVSKVQIAVGSTGADVHIEVSSDDEPTWPVTPAP